jgi:hypothetical protein
MKSANDYSLECDFTKCAQKFRCDVADGEPRYHSCVWVDASCKADQDPSDCRTKNTTKQTTPREMRTYLAGQSLLRGP